MVGLVAFLPSSRTLSALAGLRGPISVLQPNNPVIEWTQLLLRADNGQLTRISIDARDVTFKFEIFDLVAEASFPVPGFDTHEIGMISGWDTVKCLFRFEWERPPVSDEPSPKWGQTLRERGNRANIPVVATILGLSMVGIVFWDGIKSVPVAAIVSDDDNMPTFLRTYWQSAEIDLVISDCEKIDVDKAGNWIAQFKTLT